MHCKSLWIKASAKCIKCKCKCNVIRRLICQFTRSSYLKPQEEEETKQNSIRYLRAGPSLADAGPGARYGVGPPSVLLRSRYGGGRLGGGGGFRSSRGAGPGATAPVAPPKGRPCASCSRTHPKRAQAQRRASDSCSILI